MKLDRLLAITMLLLNRQRVSAKELSERFEVSLRTVYRDIDTINQAGIPIVSFAGASGGYEIMDQYRLDRQFLSLEELQSIIVALKGIRPGLEEREVETLLDKVGALVAKADQGSVASISRELIIDINPWKNNPDEKEKLAGLRSAIREARVIRFHYTTSQSEDSVRSVEPMGVVLKGYIWYLYGYCLLRQDYRIFRLTRMKNLEALPQRFERREKTLEQLDYHWHQREQEDGVRLVLHVQPSARMKAEEYFCSGEIAVQPDGSLLITTAQPEDRWLYSMLLGYGCELRVLEPPHMAQKLRTMAQKIVELYSAH